MWSKVCWSIVEVEWLKKNRDLPINQLCIQLNKSRNALTNKLLEIDGLPVPSKKKNKISIIGKRTDLNNLFLRSAWEANVLRYLNHLDIKWMYEPKVFFFEGIKRGTLSYMPDIYLPEEEKWIEVKGQLKPKDKTAIRRFKKFYPDEFSKLVGIPGSKNTKAAEFFREMNIPIFAYMNELNKKYKKVIEYWE